MRDLCSPQQQMITSVSEAVAEHCCSLPLIWGGLDFLPSSSLEVWLRREGRREEGHHRATLGIGYMSKWGCVWRRWEEGVIGWKVSCQ